MIKKTLNQLVRDVVADIKKDADEIFHSKTGRPGGGMYAAGSAINKQFKCEQFAINTPYALDYLLKEIGRFEETEAVDILEPGEEG